MSLNKNGNTILNSLRAAFCLLFLLAFLGEARAGRPGGASAQTLVMPSGPASLKGLGESFSPNMSTGTGNFSVPIEVAPGILKPSVSLSYTGGKGKGVAGMSFDLPVLHIYRTTDKGSPEFLESDRFAVSGPTLNDELVLVDSAQRVYRLKNEGAFVLFERDAAHDSWTIRMPDGTTAFLGESLEGCEKSGGKTAKWFVQRSADRFGHEVRYSYSSDKGKVYLEEIRYQLHAAEDYQNSIVFLYEARPDVSSEYTYGSRVTCDKRLDAIEVYHGARRLRRYDLEYKRGLLFSLLTSVRMEGEQGEEMPPLSFSYVEPSTDSGKFVKMTSLPPLEGLAYGTAVLEDMNGDSLPDLLYGLANDYYYYENLDGRNWSDIRRKVAGSPDQSLSAEGLVLADLNGDGFRDVVQSHGGGFRYYPGGDIGKGVFRGFGEAVTLRTHGDAPYHFTSSEVKMTDLNHDGRVDLLHQKPGQDEQLINLERDEIQESYIPELPVDVNFNNPLVQLMDFNGDSVLDFVLKDITQERGRVRVWFGLGHGRYAGEQEMSNVPRGLGREYYIQDVNNDSQADLIRVSGTWVTYYLNDGNLRYTGSRGDFYGLQSMAYTRKLLFEDMNGNGTTDIIWLPMDCKSLYYLDLMGEPNFGLLSRVDNGMGLVTEISYRSSTEYMIQAKKRGEPWKTPMPISVPVISEIWTTDSLDVLGLEAGETRTTFEYRDGYYDGKEREFRGFAEVISTSHGDDFHETLVTETWMHVGRNLKSGEDEEILKGKPYLQLTRDASGNLYSSAETTWERRWLCQEDLTGISKQILPNCRNYADKDKHKDSLVAFAVQTEGLSGSWEKTNSPRWTATTSEFNEWGSAIRTKNHGEVAFAGSRQPGQGFDLDAANVYVGEDEMVSDTDFIYDVDKWIIGLPYYSSTLDIDEKIQVQSQTYYDGALSLGVAEKGLVTRSTTWLEGEDGTGRWIDVKRMEYNADGLLVATRDANSNLVELEYDTATRSFPVTERLHLESGPIEYKAAYDTGLGSITKVWDFNDNTSSFVHDGLGRLQDVVDPLGRLATYFEYQYGTADYPLSTTTIHSLIQNDEKTGENVYRTAWQFSDGLGRGRLTKTEAENAHGYIGSGWTRFSQRGAATHVYDSFSSQYEGFEPPPSHSPVTVSYLDPLGRPTRVFPPASEEHGATFTLTEYYPFETWVYDEQDTKEKNRLYPAVTKVDGAGRVREIIKHNDVGGNLIALNWRVDYNTMGSIVGFTDPQGNPRAYTYDNLQRMTGVHDPNAGAIAYIYDDLGNLIKRVDALEQTQTFEYGMANRLQAVHMSQDANGAADYSYFYHYDTPAAPLENGRNLMGKLAWVEWPTGTQHVSYDELGRPETETQTLWDGTSSFQEQIRDTFSQSYEYNAGGQLVSQHVPGGLFLAFQYNERSLLSGVFGGLDGDTRPIFDNIQYDHRGGLRKTDNRNGTSTCSWYDIRARLAAALSGPTAELSCDDDPLEPNPAAFQHLTYSRTATGLISSINDLTEIRPGVPRFGAGYQYDRLYQLTGADTPDGAVFYAYDSIQNLVRRSTAKKLNNLLSADFHYGENGIGPNQITSAGDKKFAYNAVGQMKEYNGFALRFDVEGRLVSARKLAQDSKPESASIEYHYDDIGEKKLAIIKKAGKSPKVYRYISDEYQIRDGKETWIVSGGQGQAEISKAQGLEVDLTLLDELNAYVDNPQNHKKPLPAEYMDLDRDGDYFFDELDLEVATTGYWTDEKVGQDQLIWRFYHKDHLGGSTVVTDSLGDVVSTLRYHPYGQTAEKTGQKPIYGFAGGEIEEEEELGLIRFGARWYAPEIGRWVSADPLYVENPKQNLDNPLESNAYVYAFNNPIGFVDPSGFSGTRARPPKPYIVVLPPEPYPRGPRIRWHAYQKLGEGPLPIPSHGSLTPSEILARLPNPYKRMEGSEMPTGGYVVTAYRDQGRRASNWDGYIPGNKPGTWRPAVEAHHFFLDAWCEANIPGYNRDDAPTILMRTVNHDATRAVYAEWAKREAPKFFNTNTGKFEVNWRAVSFEQIRVLSVRMSDAGLIPQEVREEGYRQFSVMLLNIETRIEVRTLQQEIADWNIRNGPKIKQGYPQH